MNTKNHIQTLLSHTKSAPAGEFPDLLHAASEETAACLDFLSKDEYLSWVISWKAAWHRLSLRIRIQRADCRSAQAGCRPAKLEHLRQQSAADSARLAELSPAALESAAISVAETVWGGPGVMKKAARWLLMMRRAGKIAAARSRQKALSRQAQ